METFKNILHKLKPFMNKYIMAILVLFVFIVFLDQNSVMKRLKLEQEISRLKKEIRHYEKLRDQSSNKLESLKAGKDELERVAREEYHMKKENEEIFLIEESNE